MSGFPCGACGAPKTDVIDSRLAPRGFRRRRACPVCKARVTTIELPVEVLADALGEGEKAREILERLRSAL